MPSGHDQDQFPRAELDDYGTIRVETERYLDVMARGLAQEDVAPGPRPGRHPNPPNNSDSVSSDANTSTALGRRTVKPKKDSAHDDAAVVAF